MAKTRDALSVQQGQTRKGLQVRRLFTTDDAHPYDELTWERRDAVITNWRDGSVAFEQRDLEFPATWSQNATNIVAQKYFRGPLGTPQREHSVRQMIDRVAGTITNWGVKDGYFAGQADAESFRSELTHLLVNQRAAFNSPVWFNVGVEPHPQCSACFILSVEDTMPSILNWYVEEGLIFKGGSGSGINLSTIRSSKEALGNGGEASGPVSFMRGADASAGTIKSGGKCFREGTLVATPSGMQPIERLRVGDEVLTHKGPRAVADFMRNGRRQCYRVLTREGYEVEVTAGHKFAYWNSIDDCFDVKPIEGFKPGDALYALLEPCSGGTTIPLLPPEIADPANVTTTVQMSLPTELDERLAYVLGLIYGDGELRTEYPYRVRVSFAKDAAGRVSAQRFRDYSKALFGEEPLLLGDASGHQQLGFTRMRLVEFLVANGIAKGKADALGFPSMLFRAEPGVRAAFVAGVIDADGSYQRRGGWNIASIDRAFLVDLQRLLLTLGVPAKLKLNRESNGTWRRLYRLHVAGHTFIRRLVEHIAPHSAKAQVTYEPSPGADKGWGYRPSLLRPLASRVTQRGGRRLIERGVGMNETSGYGAVATLARHPEAAVAGYAQELSTCVQLTLEAVTPTEVAETYDIEVEDVHLLSANGIYASNTRRAAKMVVLNVDHPDVRDFIWCKAREEHKARVLRDAGFDMDLDGRDSISIQYQNANNSVRVTDEFMRAYESDGEFDLKAVLDGHTVERARARALMREIAQAAWECADPGMQYDTVINDWHTTPESGRINASNPCFTGETLVHTDKGLIRFDELARRAVTGETFGIYTHDATSPDAPAETVALSRHDAVMVTGTNPIVRLTLSNGAQIRCTPNHRFWTANRGWVAAQDLQPTDEIRFLDHETPATAADHRLPIPTDIAAHTGKGDRSAPMRLPEKWDPQFAHLLGWLVGDGSFSGNVISAVYGSAEDRETILPQHQSLFNSLNGGRELKISVQGNGTVQLRLSRRALASFFDALGLKRVKAAGKEVPWSILQAPTDIVCAFLRGLFDADGTVVDQRAKASRYVGLGSRSIGLLRSVQTLLSSLGITSSIYSNGRSGPSRFVYTGREGVQRSYQSAVGHDLRITGTSIDRFAAMIGFQLPSKAGRLESLVSAAKYRKANVTKLVRRENDGFALTYNLSEPKNHSYIVQGAIVANCSEYMHLDNSACNLASLNLLKFLGADGVFDVEAFKHAVEVMFLAQEIIVGNSSYPTDKITKNANDYRQLGLGYANLGALLMAQGLPYDSDGGRAWAAAITALMTGHAYRTSARVAQVRGPFAGYTKNRTPMLRVMAKHRKAVDDIDASAVQPSLLDAARKAWDETLQFGAEHGFRNAQASVIAPTGTIGLLMDCDTTGVEPDLALVKTKKLVGGGSMSIVNQTVPRALRQLGYADEHVQAILEYIAEHNSVKGAPALREEHYPVFDCAMGDSPIHYMGHIRMMAAVQPFISGAISKTVNMPESVSVEEVERAYHGGWKLGLKALAIYRDNCKVGQPLSATKSSKEAATGGAAESQGDRRVVADTGAVLEVHGAPVRRRLPRTRPSKTTSFRVGDIEGYLTAGSYPDDGLGEIFVKVSKQGSTLSGVMDAFAIAVSLGLQYGVPLEVYVAKFSNMIFEPNGITDDPDIRITQSLVDYIARRLAIDNLDVESRQALGIKTTAERIEEVNGNGSPGAASPEASASTGATAPADVSPPADTPVEPAERHPAEQAEGPSAPEVEDTPTVVPASPRSELAFTPGMAAVDAPFCSTCGVRMRPAGSCFVCESCGTTSGCS